MSDAHTNVLRLFASPEYWSLLGYQRSTAPSFLLDNPTGSLIDIMRVGGGPFSFLSIALAPFIESSTTVMFTSTRAGGNAVLLSAAGLVGIALFRLRRRTRA